MEQLDGGWGIVWQHVSKPKVKPVEEHALGFVGATADTWGFAAIQLEPGLFACHFQSGERWDVRVGSGTVFGAVNLWPDQLLIKLEDDGRTISGIGVEGSQTLFKANAPVTAGAVSPNACAVATNEGTLDIWDLREQAFRARINLRKP